LYYKDGNSARSSALQKFKNAPITPMKNNQKKLVISLNSLNNRHDLVNGIETYMRSHEIEAIGVYPEAEHPDEFTEIAADDDGDNDIANMNDLDGALEGDEGDELFGHYTSRMRSSSSLRRNASIEFAAEQGNE
jgi:hypothetical protein